MPFENYANIVGGFEYGFDENKKVIVTKPGDFRYLLILEHYDELPTIEVDPIYWQDITIQCFDVNKDQKNKNYISALDYLTELSKQFKVIIDSCTILNLYTLIPLSMRLENIERVERHVTKNWFDYKFISEPETEYFNSIAKAKHYAEKDLNQKITLKVDDFNNKYGKKNIDKEDLWPRFYAIQRYFKYESLNPKTYTTKRFLVDNQVMTNELIAKNKNG